MERNKECTWLKFERNSSMLSFSLILYILYIFFINYSPSALGLVSGAIYIVFIIIAQLYPTDTRTVSKKYIMKTLKI